MTGQIPSYNGSPEPEYSLGGMVLLALAPFLVITLISTPVVVGTLLVGTALAVTLVRKLLVVYVERAKESTRTLRIPGIGTVRYRIVPR